MLVQICKLKGWKVCAVVGRPHKVSACHALGADCVVDKSQPEGLWKLAEEFAPEGFDAIFDANGVETFQASWDHLGPGGKLVVYGFHTMLPKVGGVLGPAQWARMARDWLKTPSFDPMVMVSENKSVLGFNLSFLFKRRDLFDPVMDEILGWVVAGKLVLPQITTFPLAEAGRAHAAIESAQTVGKLVLLPP
jgi:synaptic vesicle membrane protein VAT-1